MRTRIVLCRLLLCLALAVAGFTAVAQPAPSQGCEVTVPVSFRLRETQSPTANGQDFPAQTRVRIVAYGTTRQGGIRPVWARVDTAAGWLYVNPVLYRGCPAGSIAERPGDVVETPTAPPPTPSEAPPPPVPPVTVPAPVPSVVVASPALAARGALRPFPAADGQYATFDVRVFPTDTFIRVRSALTDDDDDATRICEGHCVVELPAGQDWIFVASRGGAPFWGYGSYRIRTRGSAGTTRNVNIELRHYLWANVSAVAGLGMVAGGLLGAISGGRGCLVGFDRTECAVLNVMWMVGVVASLVGYIHPSNRGNVTPERSLSVGVGPGGLSVNGTF